MFKPTKQELAAALAVAERIRETGEDPESVSKSLIYMNRRLQMLEKVFEAADRYLHFGQEEHEHAELLKAIKAAREQEVKDTEEETDFGLAGKD
jgi:hypothetical protein